MHHDKISGPSIAIIHFPRFPYAIVKLLGYVMSRFENIITLCIYLLHACMEVIRLRYLIVTGNFIGNKFCWLFILMNLIFFFYPTLLINKVCASI